MHPGGEAHTQASVASKAKVMHSLRGSPGTGVSWIVFLCRLTALRMVRVCSDTALTQPGSQKQTLAFRQTICVKLTISHMHPLLAEPLVGIVEQG